MIKHSKKGSKMITNSTYYAIYTNTTHTIIQHKFARNVYVTKFMFYLMIHPQVIVDKINIHSL